MTQDFRLSAGVLVHTGPGAAPLHRNPIPAPDTTADTLGWTELAPDVTLSRICYVADAAAGVGASDSNNGFYPEFLSGQNGPKLTIAAAMSVVRSDGVHGDWLLCRRGSVWNTGFGSWTKSGVSQAIPIVVGAYGSILLTPRPKFLAGTSNGLQFNGTVSNVAFIDLDIEQSYTDNNFSRPVNMEGGAVHNLLLEGCLFANGNNNVTLSSSPANRSSNIIIRRCVLQDAYRLSGGPGACGFYMQAIDGLLIEENVIDRCGGQYPEHVHTSGFVVGHAFYIQGDDNAGSGHNGCTGVTIRGNVVARGDGIGIRSSAVVRNNLVLRSNQGLTFGTNGLVMDGFTIEIFGNVFLGSDNLYPQRPAPPYGSWTYADNSESDNYARGAAMVISNVLSGDTSYNIIAHSSESTSRRQDQSTTGGNQPIGIFCQAESGGIQKGYTNGAMHHNVVYNWGGGLIHWTNPFSSLAMGFKTPNGGNHLDTVSFHHNDIQFVGSADEGRCYHVMNHDGTGREQMTSANNRFFAEKGPTGAAMDANKWNTINGAEISMAAWKSATPADTTSTFASAVSYSHPDRHMADYFTSLGGKNGVLPDGTQESFLASCRLQRKGLWSFELMPTSRGANITGPGIPNYNAIAEGTVGTSAESPLAYIREGFDLVVP